MERETRELQYEDMIKGIFNEIDKELADYIEDELAKTKLEIIADHYKIAVMHELRETYNWYIDMTKDGDKNMYIKMFEKIGQINFLEMMYDEWLSYDGSGLLGPDEDIEDILRACIQSYND